jgi:hypothetical protein
LGIEYHVHTHFDWKTLVERIEGKKKIFVPLRRPETVWRSWCRRHNPRVFPYASFFLSWATLQMVANKFEVDVICIDKKEDPRITDWSPVGGDDGSHAGWKLHKTDLRPLFNLPIVFEHYGYHST